MTHVATSPPPGAYLGPDLSDPHVHAGGGLGEVFAHLRATNPVAWHPSVRPGAPGFWVLSRHADVMAMCRAPGRFTSVHGNVLDTLTAGGDSAGGRMLAVTDGRRHTVMRRLLWETFTPEALASLGARIAASTSALVANAVAATSCDFAQDVAARIPLTAICDLLGVPESDHASIFRWASESLGSQDPGFSAASARLAQSQLLLHLAKLARARRAESRDDLISLLAQGTVDGVRLTDDDVMLNCYSLVLGGDETARLAMVGAVLALVQHPAQWRALKDGTVSVEAATEEILRWTVPAVHVGRTATEDVEMHGRIIRAGDVVTGWTLSANFDETAFTEPDVLDLGRTPNRHLTFAYGPHFCLGVHLARIEIATLLEVLRTTVDHMKLDGEPRPIYSNFLRGFTSLPVRLYA